MLLCLSSAARRRYLEDVVRSVAMPEGSILPFRYDASIVEPSVMEDSGRGSLVGSAALISFIDRSRPGIGPNYVPTRLGRIAGAERVGRFLKLDIRLEQFADVQDPANFDRRLLDAAAGGSLPHWVREASEWKRRGYFLVRAERLGVGGSTGAAVWQELVSRLASKAEFRSQEYGRFFKVDGIFHAGTGRAVPFRDGHHCIEPRTTYELRVGHWTVGEPSGVEEIEVSAQNGAVAFETRNTLKLDSDYDIAAVRFSSLAAPKPIKSFISLRHLRAGAEGSAGGRGEAAAVEFDLPLSLRGDRFASAVQAAVVSLPPTATGALAVFASGKQNFGWVVAVLVVGALAFLVAFFAPKAR